MKTLLLATLALGLSPAGANADFTALTHLHHNHPYICHEGQETYYEEYGYSGNLVKYLYICRGGTYVRKFPNDHY